MDVQTLCMAVPTKNGFENLFPNRNTMKNLHKVTKSSQYPQFWNEEWLQAAIHEVDKKAMTQEQRLMYEMTISANALAIKNENKKNQKARELENTQDRATRSRFAASKKQLRTASGFSSRCPLLTPKDTMVQCPLATWNQETSVTML